MMDLKRIEAAVVPILDQEAVELVDLRLSSEGGRRALVFFVDKAAGLTLDDCHYLSDRIGAMLDGENLVSGNYALEVSSPGFDRVIKKEKDFQRFAGRRVRVRLKLPVEGQRNFKGILKGCEAGEVSLEADGRAVRFAFSGVDEARLDPEVEL